MDLISLILFGITALFLVTGLLFGLKRGAIRSIVRLVTILASAVIAWFVRPLCVKLILGIKFGGSSFQDMLQNEVLNDGSIASLVSPLIEALFGAILFIVAFLAMKLVTAILFLIFGRLFKKGDKCLGGIIGLLQGALIAFCICVPLNGTFLDIGKVMQIRIEGAGPINAETQQVLDDLDIDFESFSESRISQFYTKLGGGIYKKMTTTETEDGQTVSLTVYMDVAVSATKFVDEITKLSQMDFEHGISLENRDSIKQSFRNMNKIKDEMSDEAIATINDLLDKLIEAAGEEMPAETKNLLKEFDLAKIDFEKEGNAVLMLYSLQSEETETTLDVSEAIHTLAETKILLTFIEMEMSTEDSLEIHDDQMKAEVEMAIADVQKTNPEAAASLKKIFGLK